MKILKQIRKDIPGKFNPKNPGKCKWIIRQNRLQGEKNHFYEQKGYNVMINVSIHLEDKILNMYRCYKIASFHTVLYFIPDHFYQMPDVGGYFCLPKNIWSFAVECK